MFFTMLSYCDLICLYSKSILPVPKNIFDRYQKII